VFHLSSVRGRRTCVRLSLLNAAGGGRGKL
jgi:hypothetical protein